MISNILNCLTRVICHSGSMSQKVSQWVIFVVTKRTSIFQIGDFKLVVIILQLFVISTLIVFQTDSRVCSDFRYITIVGLLLRTLITRISSPPLFGLFLLLLMLLLSSTLAVNTAIWSNRVLMVVVNVAVKLANSALVIRRSPMVDHVRKRTGETCSDTNWRSTKAYD